MKSRFNLIAILICCFTFFQIREINAQYVTDPLLIEPFVVGASSFEFGSTNPWSSGSSFYNFMSGFTAPNCNLITLNFSTSCSGQPTNTLEYAVLRVGGQVYNLDAAHIFYKPCPTEFLVLIPSNVFILDSDSIQVEIKRCGYSTILRTPWYRPITINHNFNKNFNTCFKQGTVSFTYEDRVILRNYGGSASTIGLKYGALGSSGNSIPLSSFNGVYYNGGGRTPTNVTIGIASGWTNVSFPSSFFYLTDGPVISSYQGQTGELSFSIDPSELGDFQYGFLKFAKEGGSLVQFADNLNGTTALLDFTPNAIYNNSSSDIFKIVSKPDRYELYKDASKIYTSLKTVVYTCSDPNAIITPSTPVIPGQTVAINCTACTGTSVDLFVTMGTVKLKTVLDLNCLTLPIELVSWNASVVNKNVQLDWSTQSENESDYFVVDRSSDGLLWEEVQRVDATGNSSSQVSYRCVDLNPNPGSNYYHLKQVDNNGDEKHFETLYINFNSTDDIEIYPNPASNTFRLFTNNAPISVLRLIDLQGRVYSLETTQNKNYMDVDISKMEKGVYTLDILFLNGEQFRRQLIVD